MAPHPTRSAVESAWPHWSPALAVAAAAVLGAGRGAAQTATPTNATRVEAPAFGPPTPADTAYTPATDFPNGRQLLAVYFGATWCAPCQRLDVKAGVLRMKPLLAAWARAEGAGFSATVVALDRPLADALALVRPLGAWDEYAFGGDLAGLAAQQFIWADTAGVPAVPQVLLLERTVVVARNAPIRFGPARVLRRVLGDSIVPWVRAGAPVR